MLKPLWAAIAAASVLALGACGQTTTVEDPDSQLEQDLEQAGNELEEAADNAGDELEEAGNEAEEAVEDATDGNPNTNP